MARTIYIDGSDLPRDKRGTYIGIDAVAGGTALTVQSIIGFESLSTSSGQIVLIGPLGNEKSEIRRTDQNNAAAGTTVSLRDPLLFDHSQDTPVTIIDYNRAEIQWSATATGSKSTIMAYPVNVQADVLETIYVDSSKTTGFYFVRFNETIANTNSDWSDPIPYAGFADNTVWAIKDRALKAIHEQIDGDLITDDFLNKSLWEARREYHNSPGKRPFRRKFNIDIGNVVTGMYRQVLPADVESPTSGQNIYNVRIGTQPDMRYYDKKSWDFDYMNRPHATLAATYSIGARDLYLSDVRDFADTGVASIGGTNISYSARSVSGGTLRISADGSWGSDNASDVWQNISYGLPDRFTVWADVGGSAYIYFNRPIDTAYVNQNIYSDYYRTIVDFDSDADVLDEPDYDMFVPYLSYRIKERKSRGGIPVVRTKSGQVVIADADYQNWTQKKQQNLDTEYIGAELRMFPDQDYFYGTTP